VAGGDRIPRWGSCIAAWPDPPQRGDAHGFLDQRAAPYDTQAVRLAPPADDATGGGGEPQRDHARHLGDFVYGGYAHARCAYSLAAGTDRAGSLQPRLFGDGARPGVSVAGAVRWRDGE